MNNFEKAFIELKSNEGGFKCEAKDRMDWTGGQIGVGKLIGTNCGISAGTYPHLDIKNLTQAEIKALYKQDWWDRFKGDLLPYELAYQVFDSEVNHGKTMGVKFLQRALGVNDDGAFGPNTMKAMTGRNESQIIMRFLAVRLRYFTDCKTWDINGRGWARRVADNLIRATEPS